MEERIWGWKIRWCRLGRGVGRGGSPLFFWFDVSVVVDLYDVRVLHSVEWVGVVVVLEVEGFNVHASLQV